jgi:hexulose-6-phosphate isomerase
MVSQWTRRHFLKAGGTLVAAGAFGSPAAASSRRQIKKAIMYGTIGFKGSIMEKLKAVRAAGFEGVEPTSHLPQEEVLRALETTGLKAASVCCSTHWARPLSDPDEAVRRDGREGIIQALKDAKRYGASSILVVPGIVNKHVSYADCFRRSVAEIRRLVPLAQELGVKMAIENVWNDFITKPQQALEFLDAVGSPQVGWHFDIGNTIRYSPPQTWIPVLGKRILKLHIKEYSRVKGFGVRLFEGDDDWPAIMAALDKAGYHGWGIAEQPGEQSRDAAAMADLSRRMDRAFAS